MERIDGLMLLLLAAVDLAQLAVDSGGDAGGQPPRVRPNHAPGE